MFALRPALLLLLGALLAPAAARAESAACGAPPELLESGASLPVTARAVATGRLRVLATGSASVLGPGTSGPEAAWPARLRVLLEARHPGLRVEMVVRGARGLTAADTAALITEELAQGQLQQGGAVQLVLWQAGTVEAVRGLDLDDMVDVLNAGLDRLRAQGVDAVLIDPQFSRFLRANANIDVYRDMLRLVAAAHAVPLLRRYELMRYWAETERVDLERAPRSRRIAVADRLNDCLARAMAELLESGMAEAQPAPRP
jgi:acyl-CoA thioesterase-1